MEHICVHVAIEGTSEAWRSVGRRLQAADAVRLVAGRGTPERVDVVFYDVSDDAAARRFSIADERREFWVIGVDLDSGRVVSLAGSQYALTSVDDLATVIRESGFALRSPGSGTGFETGD